MKTLLKVTIALAGVAVLGVNRSGAPCSLQGHFCIGGRCSDVERSAFFLRMFRSTCRRSERCLTLSDRDDALVVVEEIQVNPGIAAEAWFATIQVRT